MKKYMPVIIVGLLLTLSPLLLVLGLVFVDVKFLSIGNLIDVKSIGFNVLLGAGVILSLSILITQLSRHFSFVRNYFSQPSFLTDIRESEDIIKKIAKQDIFFKMYLISGWFYFFMPLVILFLDLFFILFLNVYNVLVLTITLSTVSHVCALISGKYLSKGSQNRYDGSMWAINIAITGHYRPYETNPVLYGWRAIYRNFVSYVTDLIVIGTVSYLILIMR